MAMTDEGRYGLGRNRGVYNYFISMSLYPLLNRGHNSDSMVYINRAWIARIKEMVVLLI
jgi:hypothetical protein